MDNHLKEVYFYQFCRTCRYYEKGEGESTCDICLCKSTNTDSHKPTKWKERL